MKRLAISLLLAGFVLPLAPRVFEAMAVNPCLDRGGSYDYLRSSCDFRVSHPFIPWSRRPHSRVPLALGMVASLSAFALLLLARRP